MQILSIVVVFHAPSSRPTLKTEQFISNNKSPFISPGKEQANVDLAAGGQHSWALLNIANKHP